MVLVLDCISLHICYSRDPFQFELTLIFIVSLAYISTKRNHLRKINVLICLDSIHMQQVSAYIIGEFGHLLARRPGCSPKELFSVIHEKLPAVS